MLKTRSIIWMFSVGVIVLGMDVVCGQTFPNKPLRIITTAPGGSADIMSRLIGQGLTESWGQPVIVDNRGNIGGEFLAKAAPDGYTLLLDGFSLWLSTLLVKMPYEPLAFTPLTIVTQAPNVFVVPTSLPAKSIKELIALAKSKPGELNYGAGGIGGTAHLAVELFKSMAGVNLVLVNYAGTGQAVNAVVAGEVQLMIANPAVATPHMKSGRLRALAVGSLQPSVLVPDIPTVSASGLPGFESLTFIAMVTAAKTPAALTNRLNQEIVRVLNRPDVKERLFSIGTESVGSSPQVLADKITSEMTKWGKVIKEAGIRVN